MNTSTAVGTYSGPQAHAAFFSSTLFIQPPTFFCVDPGARTTRASHSTSGGAAGGYVGGPRREVPRDGGRCAGVALVGCECSRRGIWGVGAKTSDMRGR